MRRAIITFAICALAAGCGSDDPPEPAAEKTARPAQQIDDYAMTLSPQQKKRILPDDPNPLAGRWTMKVNRTLEIIDVGAPDGGGFTLGIEELGDERLVVEDSQCGGARLEFRIERTGDGMRLTGGKGDCRETIALLSVNAWSPA